MLSVSRKRWFVFAGVLSSASETDSAALGGRDVEALSTGMPFGYWPGRAPVHPVKLLAVMPVHLTTPDAPKVIQFAPEIDGKFVVEATGIVTGVAGSVIVIEVAAPPGWIEVGPVSR